MTPLWRWGGGQRGKIAILRYTGDLVGNGIEWWGQIRPRHSDCISLHKRRRWSNWMRMRAVLYNSIYVAISIRLLMGADGVKGKTTRQPVASSTQDRSFHCDDTQSDFIDVVAFAVTLKTQDRKTTDCTIYDATRCAISSGRRKTDGGTDSLNGRFFVSWFFTHHFSVFFLVQRGRLSQVLSQLLSALWTFHIVSHHKFRLSLTLRENTPLSALDSLVHGTNRKKQRKWLKN